MARRFYAVQWGDMYDSDYGSTRKAEALKMAKELTRDPRHDGEEIRICLCTTDDDYCDDIIIVRENGGVCKQSLRNDTHFFAAMYHSDFDLDSSDEKIKEWGRATVYRFPSKAERDDFCTGNHLNRPISRERAYYIGWEDYVEN